jgi:hypothetical protein
LRHNGKRLRGSDIVLGTLDNQFKIAAYTLML